MAGEPVRRDAEGSRATDTVFIDVELVGAVDRDGLIYVLEQPLEVHDVPVVLVVAVQSGGAADGLEEVVVI